MNSDATEAALGLLGLSPLNHHIQVFDAHSVSPLIPLKRKQSHTTSDPLPSTDADDISCICGFTYDDGFSIACDVCSRWCHAACFGIVEGGVPEEWRCWVCQGGRIDEEQRERAVKLQRKRLKTMRMRNGRRASILSSTESSNSSSALATLNANLPTAPDTVQPSSSRISQPCVSFHVFPPDAYPHPSTHARLLKVARAWRGVTALNPPIPDQHGYSMSPLDNTTPVIVDDDIEVTLPPTVLKASPSDATSYSYSYTGGNSTNSGHTPSHLLRPPSPNSNNNAIAIPSNTLLGPYTATVLPSSAYLADPLNGYAHLGMGKPQVRLVGGGWCVGVDARELGGHGTTWARCGCWPNAVVRPVICGGGRRRKKKREGGDRENASSDEDSTTLSFGLFALRDLRADEEIVLGWEWDDGHAVHMLPALIESPGMFG
ncbi:hypothetical protein F5141DRAFT_1007912 [Pisolithus sp. B1]|nr:hypothetical protein F5141DRAFT_1007912 [Pisolithus sp. B1]